MPTAVVRIKLDAESQLSSAVYRRGVHALEASGYELVEPSWEETSRERELEVIVADAAEGGHEHLLATCRESFGLEPTLGTVTYISRGTDDDARGVLQRFGISGSVRREVIDGEDLVIVTLTRTEAAKAPESRLQTALEAALNAEVRLIIE